MEIWSLNLRHLAAVAKIAELGTVKSAAVAVNLTQPAITQALARLEAQLGVPLFDRRHDGMVPTEAAGLLVPRIEAAIAQIASGSVTMSRLRAFVALADTGSYVGAAQLAGISVPSIHRAVSDLSVALRKTLVRRQGQGLFVTEHGRQLARNFRLACLELETGLSELAAMMGQETRRIAVGAMPLSRARVLPDAVNRFRDRHPQVSLSIVEGSRVELVEPLRNGAIDLMIGALRDPLMEPDLAQQALFDDVPGIYGRAGHPLAGTEAGPIEVSAYDWVVAPRGAPLRTSFERYFSDAGLTEPAVPIEAGSVMLIRQILVGSDFLTLLSPDQVAVEIEAGWLVRIAGVSPDLGRTIGYTTRIDWRPTEVQRDFVESLRLSAAPEAARRRMSN